MKILGFSGGPNAVYEKAFDIIPGMMHDSAAVLLIDGEVAAAIEQERLDRIKHSNKHPIEAMRFCLDYAGVRIDEIDRFAFYGEQGGWDRLLADYRMIVRSAHQVPDARTFLRLRIQEHFGHDVGESQPQFVGHHMAHAMSAMAMSGYQDALVLVIDGQGDDIAGLVLDARGSKLDVLSGIPITKSLGNFYLRVVELLGYRLFDEYKVMGLAPYGDPARHQDLFQTFYALEPGGGYSIHWDRLRLLLDVLPPPKAEPTTQDHKDVAASLQKSLEEIVFHLVRHYRNLTGHRHLCLAGGVAHNCTLNGKLLYSGLFDGIFVQPASHDAGCALGAALFLQSQEAGIWKHSRLEHVYWGTPIGPNREIEAELSRWHRFLDIAEEEDVCAAAAALLAEGQVLGWVQGRSEFGPRAPGNRSIVADPRPPGHKDLINAMVKKREAFRPFAPSVLEERALEFFDLPPGSDLPFMVFTVDVKSDKREILGAVTHVDGSARIQTVSRKTNERYWRLIKEFCDLTGVPLVLNTSFNNNAEPIVESVRDAVVCFLTTQLNALAVGDFLVHKKPVAAADYLELAPELPRHMELRQTRACSPSGWEDAYEAVPNSGRPGRRISKDMFKLLLRADGWATLGDLARDQGVESSEALVEEALELWGGRYVVLAPQNRE